MQIGTLQQTASDPTALYTLPRRFRVVDRFTPRFTGGSLVLKTQPLGSFEVKHTVINDGIGM